MTWPDSAAVIGLGLIGGSVARALRDRGVQVSGWDRDPATLAAAAAEGVVDPLPEQLARAAASDLVMIAVPVSAALEVLARLTPHLTPESIVTDVGSTKCSIVRAAADLGIDDRFVGSHPLAGDHRSGWEASRSELFAGVRVFVTPSRNAPATVVGRVASVWTALGARPEVTDAVSHDVAMAWASHLPQALSTTLGLALADARVRPNDLGPGGRDVTRLAGSSPAMWSEILADNADHVVAALRTVSSRLGSLTAAVERGDLAELRRMFMDARRWAEDEPEGSDEG